MVTCGGQVTIPVIAAIMKIHQRYNMLNCRKYCIKICWLGTRNNIDEYTQTTKEGIETIAHSPKQSNYYPQSS